MYIYEFTFIFCKHIQWVVRHVEKMNACSKNEWNECMSCRITQARRNRVGWGRGGGEGGCSPPRFLVTSIFDELKKIVLK